MQACTDTIERDINTELEDEYRKLEEEAAQKQAQITIEFEKRKQKLVEKRRAKEEARRKMEVAVEEAKRRAEEEKRQQEEEARRIEEEKARRLEEEECQRLKGKKAAEIEALRAEASVRVKELADQVIKGTKSFEELERAIQELEKVNGMGEDEVEEVVQEPIVPIVNPSVSGKRKCKFQEESVEPEKVRHILSSI
jgi:hypothetical protein